MHPLQQEQGKSDKVLEMFKAPVYAWCPQKPEKGSDSLEMDVILLSQDASSGNWTKALCVRADMLFTAKQYL